MTELQVSTSPRMTWLWAPDEHAAQRVREITSGSSATHRGEALALVTDVGIGVEALAACEELAKSVSRLDLGWVAGMILVRG
ncbi:hypothetical protein [Saccharomonospora glauca]|uniref:Uncharacterized protein n=1 Tax=Saccharomonospora glauca K62 TaxID=928724 RepID=I1D4K3_9PSEU|nr:hypothetical protein [Saccharomonospora glauca]EIE99877.1 hypothetical protein SacglDRAFT_03009 [Saccharomonospora glauca K62]